MLPIDLTDDTKLFDNIQAGVCNMLEADAFFSNVPVLAQIKGDIESGIEMALGNLATGICVAVLTPVGKSDYLDLMEPFYNDIPVVVRVMERTVINRGITTGTQKTPHQVAVKVQLLLWNKSPEGLNILNPVNPPIIENPEAPEGETWLDCQFVTSGGRTA